jgi:alanine racemase
MSITAKIIYVKAVPENFSVSYGCTHVTTAPTVIATVPIGYADGYSRLLSNQGHMLVKGQKAPIVGRITMDFTMIDVGHIPGVKPGDDVTILGPQGNERITADDIAALTGTINYEVTTGLTGRMPLSYV